MLHTSLTAKSAARGRTSILRDYDRYHSRGYSHLARFEPLESRHLLTATVIQVTTTTDTVDPNDGLISLREAILEANTSPDDNEIQLPAGTYTLTRQGANEDGALTGDLDVLNNGSLKIVGAGSGTATIDGSGLIDVGLGVGDRLFDILPNSQVEFHGLTFANARSDGAGGAIRANQTQLTIVDCSFLGNRALKDGGGAISAVGNPRNYEALTIENSVFVDNSVAGSLGDGGAIFGLFVTGSVNDSRFEGNSASNGGAIHAFMSTFSLSDAFISKNSAQLGGGGIYANRSPLTIHNSRITGNTAEGGGGVAAGEETFIIGGSIDNNTAQSSGGGILASGAITLTNVSLRNNSAQFGGGAYLQGGPATLSGVEVSDNSATDTGGGIFSSSSNFSIVGSTISGNSAREGGGILGTGTIANSTISGNIALESGGGINGYWTVRNSTVTGNRADSDGNGTGVGGGFASSPVDARMWTVLNTIVAGNLRGAVEADLPDDIKFGMGTAAPASAFNLIGDPASAGGLVHGVNGNIVGDGAGNPLDVSTVLDTTLADNGGPTLTHALVPGSPAFNAGDPLFDPNATSPPISLDQRGTGFARVKLGRLDIGAFEGIPDPEPVGGVIVVGTFADVLDNEDGVWSLREAVIYANTHAEDNVIQLSAGTYQLTRKGATEEKSVTGDLDILNYGKLTIVGAGAASTTIDATGLIVASNGFGDRIFDAQPGSVATIEGLLLTGGKPVLPASQSFQYGGAIRLTDSTIVMTDCELSGNAARSGGAIYNRSGQLTMTDSTVKGNTAVSGGGIVVDAISSSRPGKATLNNCNIFENTASSGGGIHLANGLLYIANSAVAHNNAANGGGIAVSRGSGTNQAMILRSTLVGNSARERGGAIYNIAGKVSIVESTIFKNTAVADGGGVFNINDSEEIHQAEALTVRNSTLSGNSANGDGGGLYSWGNIAIRNSSIVDNRADAGGNATGLGGGLFLFTETVAKLHNTIIAGNIRGTAFVQSSGDIWLGGGQIDPASSFNLVGDPNTAGGLVHGVNGNIVGDGSGNLLDVSTVLDTTLADNGGPTLTHALVPGSPAFNTADPLFDPNATNPPTPFDQRGAGYARVAGGRLDIGAVESDATFQAIVAGRHVFYDDSAFDNHTAGPNAADLLAIAPDKQALLPGGGLATSKNVTSYSSGINGIMVDIAGAHPGITAADFSFHVGNSNSPETWGAAPAPASVVVLAGQGVAGADRVVITWPSGAIVNTWLEVQVLATENTGLAAADVFYWGNKAGDTFVGTPAGTFDTLTNDAVQVFAGQGTAKPVTNERDFNRDGVVNTADAAIVFANLGSIVRLNVPAIAAPAAIVASAADANGTLIAMALASRSQERGGAEAVKQVIAAAPDTTLATRPREQVFAELAFANGIGEVTTEIGSVLAEPGHDSLASSDAEESADDLALVLLGAP